MRLLLEIVIAALLIGVAWNKSFKDWASEAPLIGAHLKSSARSSGPNGKAPVPAATASGSPKSFTGHIYYTDEQGKSYWLDAQGKRHYDP
jgi:hypothetical protein